MRTLTHWAWSLPIAIVTVGCTCADRPAAPKAPRGPAVVTPTPLDRVAMHDCTSAAWIDEEHPKTVDARGAPVPDGRVIAELPQGAMLTITAQRGRWVRISKAAWVTPAESQRSWPMGVWVSQDGLRTGLRPYGEDQEAVLRAEPDVGSEARMRWAADDVEASGRVIPWNGCRGDWVATEIDGTEGWLSADDVCPSPLTTCS